MRTCQKAIPATGAARVMTVGVAGVMEVVVADSAANAETAVAVFVERGPAARRVVIADPLTDLLALVDAPVNAEMIAVVLAGTDEAVEIVVDSADAMTAIAARVSRLHPPWPD